MKKNVLLISICLLFGISGSAQNPGELDSTFGVGGYLLSDPYLNTGEAYFDMISLQNDKIVKVGYSDDGNNKDVLVARFLENGVPDSTFSLDGFLEVDLSIGGNEEAKSVYELPNGELLITGYVQTISSLDGFILKIKDDGTVDNAFGYEGGHTKFNAGDDMICEGKGIAYDGSEIYVGSTVLVSAQVDLMLININADGTIDSSFATNGRSIVDIDGGDDRMNSLDRLLNGNFVFGGYADSSGTQIGYVAALSQFGTPATFGTNGIYRIDEGAGENFVNDIYVDENDNIFLVGGDGIYPNVNGFVKKLTSSGTLDNTFGSNGTMMSDPGATTALYFTGITMSADGNIIATGNFEGASEDLYAMALESDGSLYNDFGSNGDISIPMSISTNELYSTASAVQSDGSVIIGGYLTSQDFVGENMFMVRLNSTIITASIENNEPVSVGVYPNPTSDYFKIDSKDNVQSVEMISLNGAVIANWQNQNNYAIPVNVVSGTYLLRINTVDGIGFSKIIVR